MCTARLSLPDVNTSGGLKVKNFEHQWGLKVNRFDQVPSGGHQMSVVGGPRPVPRASGESHVWRGHGGGGIEWGGSSWKGPMQDG